MRGSARALWSFEWVLHFNNSLRVVCCRLNGNRVGIFQRAEFWEGLPECFGVNLLLLGLQVCSYIATVPGVNDAINHPSTMFRHLHLIYDSA